jgi:hypothetical protein
MPVINVAAYPPRPEHRDGVLPSVPAGDPAKGAL